MATGVAAYKAAINARAAGRRRSKRPRQNYGPIRRGTNIGATAPVPRAAASSRPPLPRSERPEGPGAARRVRVRRIEQAEPSENRRGRPPLDLAPAGVGCAMPPHSPLPAVPPSVGVPGSTTTTTTTSPTADHRTTITKGVDANGNEITKKDTHREGVAGSSESHTTTMTDPDGGTTTTRSKSPSKQE